MAAMTQPSNEFAMSGEQFGPIGGIVVRSPSKNARLLLSMGSTRRCTCSGQSERPKRFSATAPLADPVSRELARRKWIDAKNTELVPRKFHNLWVRV